MATAKMLCWPGCGFIVACNQTLNDYEVYSEKLSRVQKGMQIAYWVKSEDSHPEDTP